MNRLPCEMLQLGMLDVVVVGAIGIDTNVYTQAGSIDASVETHFTETLDYVGQSGGFSSRGFARLGKKTAVIGYVGDDYSGAYIHRRRRHRVLLGGAPRHPCGVDARDGTGASG